MEDGWRKVWTKGLSKKCPICGKNNMAHFGRVLPSNDLLLSYTCGYCNHKYIKRKKAPEITVERWNSPGRPRK